MLTFQQTEAHSAMDYASYKSQFTPRMSKALSQLEANWDSCEANFKSPPGPAELVTLDFSKVPNSSNWRHIHTGQEVKVSNSKILVALLVLKVLLVPLSWESPLLCLWCPRSLTHLLIISGDYSK